MKSKVRFFLIFGLIILSLTVYGYLKSVPGVENEGEARPQIEITPKLFDFGQVQYGDIAKYNFTIKNTGSLVLEIKRVATSCSCTTAKALKEVIVPGEQTELQVIYNTGAMSGPHGLGYQERIIYVKSSDPINPQVEVMTKAYVK